MTIERLLEINEQVENAKSKGSEIKGQINSEKRRLKTKFNVSTLVSAVKKLEEKNKSVDQMEKTFKKELNKIEEAYEWD